MRARAGLLMVVVSLILVAPAPARAAHHLWRFSQLYSNASGSVQFIQLAVTEDNEQFVSGFTISSGANTFTIPSNLPASTTSNKWILLATAGFGSLPGGVTPDFVIPPNFFPTGGGTLNYASGTDVWTYGAVPTDGVNALHKNGATVTTSANAPENFSLQSGLVNQSSPPVPTLPAAGIAVLVGGLLLAASGVLRRGRVKRA
jgi:hypothetical protein